MIVTIVRRNMKISKLIKSDKRCHKP
jgi:hypothetical protein